MKPIITAELEIVALGTGSTSMSSHISEAVKALEKSGVKYKLTPMGTVIEVSSIDEAFNAIKAAHEAVIKKGVKRVVMHLTIDDRRDAPKGMDEKIESVKSKFRHTSLQAPASDHHTQLIRADREEITGNMVEKIRKRDGRIVEFDKSKIAKAVFKAFLATKSKDGKTADDIANQVVKIVEERIPEIPGVEDVQNIVEEILIKNGYTAVAKAYILYREKRAQIRRAKQFFGVRDELKLSVNAIRNP